jgi:hypothetical protein
LLLLLLLLSCQTNLADFTTGSPLPVRLALLLLLLLLLHLLVVEVLLLVMGRAFAATAR